MLRSMSPRLARFGRVLGRLAFVGVHLWMVGAVWYSGLGPEPLPKLLALVLLIGVPVAWYRHGNRRRVLWTFVSLAVLVIALWQLKRPSADRAWTPDMRRPPGVTVVGDLVTIRGIRDCRYRSADDYDVRHYDRTFDLRQLRSIDYVVERFHRWDALAHTLLSFGFEQGRHVCISIELRREVGEAFHPVAGLFREFELMYVIASEQDVIGLRTNHRKSKVWLYPIRTTQERKRALFLDMLNRAQELADEPEFYNTVLSSCTTNIVDHVRLLVPGQVPLDYRILLPGYSGELAYELGLIDTELSFAEAEARYRIDERAQGAPIGEDFSTRIRGPW